MKRNKNIPLLIIGARPATAGIGGVTIHISRLLDYLDQEKFEYKFIDYKNESLIKIVNVIRHSKNVHLHINRPIAVFLFTFISKIFCTKIILTKHGNFGSSNYINNLLVRLSVIISDIPIAINEGSYKRMKRYNKNCHLMPAFIPPIIEETLDQRVLELIVKAKETHSVICSTNSYNVSYDKNGNDIYGIDFLIKTFSNFKNHILIISDPKGNNMRRFSNIPNNVWFIDFPHSYFELLKHVDIFIRNTSTDGDSLSVKEALYLNIKTLCSDCVDRPDGVRLFKYSDIDTFTKAIYNLENTEYSFAEIQNGAVSLLNLYKSII